MVSSVNAYTYYSSVQKHTVYASLQSSWVGSRFFKWKFCFGQNLIITSNVLFIGCTHKCADVGPTVASCNIQCSQEVALIWLQFIMLTGKSLSRVAGTSVDSGDANLQMCWNFIKGCIHHNWKMTSTPEYWNFTSFTHYQFAEGTHKTGTRKTELSKG